MSTASDVAIVAAAGANIATQVYVGDRVGGTNGAVAGLANGLISSVTIGTDLPVSGYVSYTPHQNANIITGQQEVAGGWGGGLVAAGYVGNSGLGLNGGLSFTPGSGLNINVNANLPNANGTYVGISYNTSNGDYTANGGYNIAKYGNNNLGLNVSASNTGVVNAGVNYNYSGGGSNGWTNIMSNFGGAFLNFSNTGEITLSNQFKGVNTVSVGYNTDTHSFGPLGINGSFSTDFLTSLVQEHAAATFERNQSANSMIAADQAKSYGDILVQMGEFTPEEIANLHNDPNGNEKIVAAFNEIKQNAIDSGNEGAFGQRLQDAINNLNQKNNTDIPVNDPLNDRSSWPQNADEQAGKNILDLGYVLTKKDEEEAQQANRYAEGKKILAETGQWTDPVTGDTYSIENGVNKRYFTDPETNRQMVQEMDSNGDLNTRIATPEDKFFGKTANLINTDQANVLLTSTGTPLSEPSKEIISALLSKGNPEAIIRKYSKIKDMSGNSVFSNEDIGSLKSMLKSIEKLTSVMGVAEVKDAWLHGEIDENGNLNQTAFEQRKTNEALAGYRNRAAVEDENYISLKDGGFIIKSDWRSQRDNEFTKIYDQGGASGTETNDKITKIGPLGIKYKGAVYIVRGSNMCNVTDLAVALDEAGITAENGSGYSQMEDRLAVDADRRGLGNRLPTGQAWDAIAKANGVQLSDVKSLAGQSKIEAMKEQLRQGKVIFAGGNFSSVSSVGGHMIAIVGYDSKGWIVQDSYGNAYTGYKSTNGRYVHYDFGKFKIGDADRVAKVVEPL